MNKNRKPSNILHQPHPHPGYEIRGRVWVDKDGELYMGGGRAILLEKIDDLGSIAAAARAMGLGYRNAWLWIQTANRLAGMPLVEKTTGGPGGGHTRLTAEGRKAVAQYKELHAKFEEFLKALGSND